MAIVESHRGTGSPGVTGNGGRDLSGQLLGSYRLEGVIGSGAFGRVYRARHVALDVLRAVKVMQGDIADQPAFRARFLQEARTAANLSHPNIVSVFDFGVQEGIQYLVLEYVESLTLGERLDRMPVRRRPEETELTRWLRDVAAALDHAHLQGVIHRDLKPSNVLVRTSDDRALLTDFGIARALSDQGLTQTGRSMGTYAYMSPEQCQGARSLTTVSDVYSLAAMLYEVATGSPPFGRGIASVAGHLERPPPPIRLAAPHLPRQVDAVLAKGLAKAPEDRQRTAGELVAAFLAALLSRSADPPAHVFEPVRPAAVRSAAAGWVPPSPEEFEAPPAEPQPRRRLPWPPPLPLLPRLPRVPRPRLPSLPSFQVPRLPRPRLRLPRLRLPRLRLPRLRLPRLRPPPLPPLRLPTPPTDRRVAIAGLGVLAVFIFGGVGVVLATRPSPGPAPAPGPATTGFPTPLSGSVGTTVVVDGLRLTVVRASLDVRPIPPAVSVPPGARVVAVEVRYENSRGGTALVSPFDWDATDGAGGVYQGTPLGLGGDLGQRELAPAETAQGLVGFVVPASVRRLVLRYNDEQGGRTVLVPLG
jgi:serine/threonine protein kinase